MFSTSADKRQHSVTQFRNHNGREQLV